MNEWYAKQKSALDVVSPHMKKGATDNFILKKSLEPDFKEAADIVFGKEVTAQFDDYRKLVKDIKTQQKLIKDANKFLLNAKHHKYTFEAEEIARRIAFDKAQLNAKVTLRKQLLKDFATVAGLAGGLNWVRKQVTGKGH